jgi:hypothetical protein
VAYSLRIATRLWLERGANFDLNVGTWGDETATPHEVPSPSSSAGLRPALVFVIIDAGSASLSDRVHCTA